MKVQKCGLNKFEAIGQLNEINLELLNGTKFYLGFIAWGDSMYEAVANCLRKMDQYLHPGDYEKCLTCGKIACMCYENKIENEYE